MLLTRERLKTRDRVPSSARLRPRVLDSVVALGLIGGPHERRAGAGFALPQ
jgi:hypothetical protein